MDLNKLVEIENLKYAYKDREALRGVTFSIAAGEIFGLLGPNGSGKTTLFRILCTALRPGAGRARIAGFDVETQASEIRERIGVVFQAPSLDAKLRVEENLMHQGRLYGLSGSELKKRTREMLERLGVWDRRKDLVGKLSGGLKRRVELAKALLHFPIILILDEPSTGLDPGARIDLWKYLKSLKEDRGTTILVTTHLMEEAAHCDRIGILSQGELVCAGAPEKLRREIGGDVILIHASESVKLAEKIRGRFGCEVSALNGTLKIEQDHGADLMARIAGAFPDEIDSVTCRKPTLEDVFIRQTGHKFWAEAGEPVHE